MTAAPARGPSPGLPQALPPCPVCEAGGETLRCLEWLGTSPDLKALGDYRVYRCDTCGTARTVPLPPHDALVISPDLSGPARGTLQRLLLDRFISQRVSRVRPLLPTGRVPRVLDVGGGACLFANAMAAAGCEVTVFEPNGANATAALPGVRFIGDTFDERSTAVTGLAPGSFDLVTMWHSLEHVTDPLATLTLARRLLREGGALHVCVPNIESMQAVLTRARWCYLDIPHHVTHFSPGSLVFALGRAGFRIRRSTTWNEEYEIFGFYQSLLNAVTGSHNYFYNRAKKGRAADPGPHPAWTRAATAAGPLLIPLTLLLAWLGAALRRPACAECSAEALA